ncbi:unnamed protein product, partial [Symbiodinium sp. CCMP2456]
MYRDEFVAVALRVPDVTCLEAISEAQQALAVLQLEYATVVSPTVPQLAADYASLVLGGPWLREHGTCVVIFDFRRLGGPAYAKHICFMACLYDLSLEARRCGYTDFAVYVAGSSEPLADGPPSEFHQGWVVQFVRPGDPPLWHHNLEARLQDAGAWSAASLPDPPPLLPSLLLGGGHACLNWGVADTDWPIPADVRVLFGRDVSGFACARPQNDALKDVCWRGTDCCGAVGVLDSRLPARDGGYGFFVSLLGIWRALPGSTVCPMALCSR